jgi:hypothetical protein
MSATIDQASPASIHDLPPLETGGVIARHGFHVQDHVAAGLCIDMLTDQTLLQVWCETQDDIALIWRTSPDWVEFVQVKSNELDQLWSVAELCKKEKATQGDGQGTSIVERSLAYDRCREKCRFRIVTTRPMNSDLEPFKLRIDCAERKEAVDKLNEVVQDIVSRTGAFKSPNGHDARYWADYLTWQVIHSLDAIENENLLKLHAAVEGDGEFLAKDQLRELYAKLLNLVKDAALERTDRQKKKILRENLLPWFRASVQDAVHPGAAGASVKLRQKMQAAAIAPDQIETAIEERRHYRLEVLSPQYMELNERKLVEGEIRARLQQLRARLDAGEVPDNGPQFHLGCLATLDTVRSDVAVAPKPPLQLLQGFMYTLTDRCLHRFRRTSI